MEQEYRLVCQDGELKITRDQYMKAWNDPAFRKLESAIVKGLTDQFEYAGTKADFLSKYPPKTQAAPPSPEPKPEPPERSLAEIVKELSALVDELKRLV